MSRSMQGQHRQRHTDHLPDALIEALRRPPGEVVAIVSTVDDDGAPRTATFGAMVPISPTALRCACNRGHATYDNLLRDGRVMVAMFAAPDVAVGIRGRARVLKQRMDTLPDNAVVQIDVDHVKDDHMPMAPIASGVTYTVSEQMAANLTAANEELAAVDG